MHEESLPPDSLPRQLLLSLLNSPPSGGIVPRLLSLLSEYDLPSVNLVISDRWSRDGWKRLTRRLLLAKEFTLFVETCSHIPLADCSSLSLGKVLPHLLVCRGLPRLSRQNNIRIRLLLNCAGLESETSNFRNATSDDTCKLCGSTSAETASHFTAQCPALSSVRNSLSPRSLIPLLASDSQLFVDYVLGTMWVDDPLFQQEVIVLLHHLYTARLDQLSAAASSLPTQ